MTPQQAMLDGLLPHLKNWMEDGKFQPPIKAKKGAILPEFPKSVLYLYLAKRDEARRFPSVTIDGQHWDVWYVGETGNLERRHAQHFEQIYTCKKYGLRELLSDFRSVNEIDMSSDIVGKKINSRLPDNKHNYTACRSSIGWSAVTHITWVEAPCKKSRIRAEEVMIAILQPPLNWLRRSTK